MRNVEPRHTDSGSYYLPQCSIWVGDRCFLVVNCSYDRWIVREDITDIVNAIELQEMGF